MKKIKCTSCGANLKVDENNEFATCEHCGSKYKLKEDLTINFKLDDETKEAINKGAKIFSKAIIIPFAIFLVIVGLIMFLAFKDSSKTDDYIKNQIEKSNEKHNQTEKEMDDKIKQTEAEFLKNDFNFKFTHAAGTKSGFFLTDILDNIIDSNKRNDKKITLIFNGKSTTDETEILNIKHDLKNNDNFEVSVNYDDDGYINEIKAEKIKK